MAEAREGWQRPTAALRLGPDEVHVWLVSVGRSRHAVERLRRVLSPDEARAAARFHGPTLQARAIIAHAALRAILARYLPLSPEQLAFARGAFGKPYLAAHPGLRFNLSHAGDLVLIAVAAGRDVGIDVEQVRDDLDVARLAEFAFSPSEVAALERVVPEQRAAAFYAGWTRKEAYVKARGLGFSLPLKSFAVSLSPGEPPALLWSDTDPAAPGRWAFGALALPPGYIGAVVVEGALGRLCCWEWCSSRMATE
jgi:4'-phosphopantetheinyl transferase